MRDPKYDVLFEPVRIGPLTAKNRFFQVPHCNGMGYRDPRACAEMRAVKAQGGWAVVCTEEVEIHYTSEVTPYIEGRIWDDRDIPALAVMAERVHECGALAGIELAYNGLDGPNLHSRVVPQGPSPLPVISGSIDPVQARAMTKRDIANLRRWHRQAVDRSLRAGFDLVYVYSGHALGAAHHFLSRRYNHRSDEYGGSLKNRMRLLRELLEDAVEEVAGRAAVACRVTVDETMCRDGIDRSEIEAVIGELGEIPDLWDFVPGTWEDDSVTSRFSAEAHEEEWVRGLKSLTSKPVVGVGRFTSPDTMVRMIRQGILDFIGAARPSIADPYLPNKIEEGRPGDIRECIGCNICVTGDYTMSPIRCTQNPSMGEEWRRGWHPERYRPRHADERVLVVGAGPAGLEAAMSLGKRGYEVVLVEKSRTLGGRVVSEARLPGLAEWIRVVDYRLGQISQLENVEHYRESDLNADEVLSHDFTHVAVATGSVWRRDGVARWHTRGGAMPIGALEVLTPDDVMSGTRPEGTRVAIYDDDHYYMGGVLAELLSAEGYDVVLVTPEPLVSAWTVNTMEQHRIQAQLMEAGVDLLTSTAVSAVLNDGLSTKCAFTGRDGRVDADGVLLVTSRLPVDGLCTDLLARRDEWADRGLRSVRAVGDALAPGTIAAAVWDGRHYAEELESPTGDADSTPYRREITAVAN